jgi:predicted small lipoprotein YifL
MSFKPWNFPAAARASAVGLACAVLALTGCGKQGPPLPPLRAIPAATKDLAARQQGSQIVLTFGYPQTSVGGTALGGIQSVELWETTRPAAADGKIAPLDAREFGVAAKLRVTVKGADLTSATTGDRLTVTLPLPTAEGTTPLPASYFAVRTYGKDGDRSDFSNVVSLLPKAPPAAPERLVVTPRADGILIEWSPVEAATAGFNVYRRDAAARTGGQPLHVAPAAEKSWLDTSAQFGQSYIYSVTSVAQREPIVESPVTSEREVRYQDRFAPDAPKELVALAEPGQVRLVWRASDATDVAGYLVFRRVGDTGSFEKITAQPVTSNGFLDSGVAAGRSYSYRVVAVDQAGNDSEPSGEARAAVP